MLEKWPFFLGGLIILVTHVVTHCNGLVAFAAICCIVSIILPVYWATQISYANENLTQGVINLLPTKREPGDK